MRRSVRTWHPFLLFAQAGGHRDLLRSSSGSASIPSAFVAESESVQNWHSVWSSRHRGRAYPSGWLHEWVESAGGKRSGSPCCVAGLIIWSALLIWLLGMIASTFFMPALVYWARQLGLRPAVAAATLVALGNGAADLFAIGTAAHARDLPLALSEALGTNMVSLTITASTVLMISRGWLGCTSLVRPDRFGCTCAAYLAAMTVSVAIMHDGQVTLLEALCLPLLYLIYVVAVSCSACQEAKPLPEAGLLGLAPEPLRVPAAAERPRLQLLWWSARLPWCALCLATIPPCSGHWDRCQRALSAVTPLGVVALLLSSGCAGPSGVTSMIPVVAVAAAASLGLWIFKSSCDDQLPWFYPGIAIAGCASCAIWLDLIASELTWVIEILGVWLQIPPTLLGFTAVAWGNSLTDLVGCVSMARCGQINVALAAVVASPLFDMSVGYGAMLFIAALSEGGAVNIGSGGGWPMSTTLQLATAACCVVASAAMLVVAFSNSWLPPWIFYAVYILFVALMISTT